MVTLGDCRNTDNLSGSNFFDEMGLPKTLVSLKKNVGIIARPGVGYPKRICASKMRRIEGKEVVLV